MSAPSFLNTQLMPRGIKDPLVLCAMRAVPRHLFVPDALVANAYDDNPLPIGHDQTISQPYIVAFMTQALALSGGERILEIGTGSGYQAAVLAEIVEQVFTIEIVPALAHEAMARLSRMHYGNVHVRIGDGYGGWPEGGPFDGIVVTAAPDHVPPALIEQLKPGGRMIVPVGGASQELILITRTETGSARTPVLPVRFVPMTGEACRT
ncbi:MAG: protein-L-isoaspartate(D-aspartate) O-methyltransferase [Candidatus Eisenbacteria bacterium]|nr:protein-L-isoaspartate(D-aspartate) O-methyltransferase [Candidatus Eisenbacteria bacterium]